MVSKLVEVRVFSDADYNLLCYSCGKTQRDNNGHSEFIFDDLPEGTSGPEQVNKAMCAPCVVKAISTGLLTLVLGDIDIIEEGDPGYLSAAEDGTISLSNGLGDAVEVRW